MRSPARRQPSDADLNARLSARIEILEDRVRRLEVLVRAAAAGRKTPSARARPGGTPAPLKSSRPRPRCPGCTLELPPGRRGEACAWCGFHFAALRRRKGSRKRKG
jgi:hypothetical protein